MSTHRARVQAQLQESPELSVPDRLLTVVEVADRLNVLERFVRRLISERRIAFTRIGRHVRIPESAVEAYITAGLVQPVVLPGRAA